MGSQTPHFIKPSQTLKSRNLLPKNPAKAIVLYTHVAGTAVIRALGQMGVPVVAFHYLPNEMGYVSRYVSECVRVPNLKEDEAAFLDCLSDLATQFEGSLLIPTDDHSLVVLSNHKKTLERSYIVAAEDWDIVSQCINKQCTYALANRMGIPCPVKD